MSLARTLQFLIQKAQVARTSSNFNPNMNNSNMSIPQTTCEQEQLSSFDSTNQSKKYSLHSQNLINGSEQQYTPHLHENLSEKKMFWNGFDLTQSRLKWSVSQERSFFDMPQRSSSSIKLWYKNLVIPSIEVISNEYAQMQPHIVKVQCWKERYTKQLQQVPLEGITSREINSDGHSIISGLKFIETSYFSQGSRFYLTVSIVPKDQDSKSAATSPTAINPSNDQQYPPQALPSSVFISQPLIIESTRNRKKSKIESMNKQTSIQPTINRYKAASCQSPLEFLFNSKQDNNPNQLSQYSQSSTSIIDINSFYRQSLNSKNSIRIPTQSTELNTIKKKKRCLTKLVSNNQSFMVSSQSLQNEEDHLSFRTILLVSNSACSPNLKSYEESLHPQLLDYLQHDVSSTKSGNHSQYSNFNSEQLAANLNLTITTANI